MMMGDTKLYLIQSYEEGVVEIAVTAEELSNPKEFKAEHGDCTVGRDLFFSKEAAEKRHHQLIAHAMWKAAAQLKKLKVLFFESMGEEWKDLLDEDVSDENA